MARLIQYVTDASNFDGVWKWQAAGMGYVIRTDNGKLIVIDGGHAVDAEPMIRIIEEQSEGKAEVDLWILTHPHGDHICALTEVADNAELRARVMIKSVMLAAPEFFKPANGKSYLREKERIDRIRGTIDATFIDPREGMTLTLDGVKLSVLATYHTLDTEEAKNINDLSTVFILETDRTRVMFTGDATERTVAPIVEKYGDELKCDIVQVSHHALDGASIPFYKAVGATVALVSMSKSGYEAMQGPKYAKVTEPSRYVIKKARHVFYSFKGEVKLEI